ncbi:hypothetical protein HDV01_005065 [Terramyces sp. JEL0728]|nr:hypothetical protein HDV01_005065 [Terramyces sp. JEL0728]
MELLELIDIYKLRFQNNQSVYISGKKDYGFNRYSEILSELLILAEQKTVLDGSAPGIPTDVNTGETEQGNSVNLEKEIPKRDIVESARSDTEIRALDPPATTLDKGKSNGNGDANYQHLPAQELEKSSRGLVILDFKPDETTTVDTTITVKKPLAPEDPSQIETPAEVLLEENNPNSTDRSLQDITKVEQNASSQKGKRKRKNARATNAKKPKITKNVDLAKVEIKEPKQSENQVSSIEDANNQIVGVNVQREILNALQTDGKLPPSKDNSQEEIGKDQSDHLIQFFSQAPQDTGIDSPDISFIPAVNLSAIGHCEMEDANLADISAFLEQDIEF